MTPTRHQPKWGQWCLVLALACLSAGPYLRAQTPPPSPATGETLSNELNPLRQMSNASQALYKKISPAIIRVKIDQSLDSLVSPALKKDFEEWRAPSEERKGNASTTTPPVLAENVPGNDSNAPGDTSHPKRPDNVDAPRPVRPSSTRPGGPGTIRSEIATLMQFRRYLENKAQNPRDPEGATRAKFIMQRLEAIRSGQTAEAYGLIYNQEGHALVLTSLLADPRERVKKTVTIINSEGVESSATVLGTDLWRDLSVIKVEHPNGFMPLAQSRPVPGEFLTLVSGYTGASNWITMPPTLGTSSSSSQPRKPGGGGEERFAIDAGGGPAESRAPCFVINLNGELAALGFEHHAVPVMQLKREFDMLETIGYVRRAQVGVKWSAVTPEERAHNPKLGNRAAIRIDDVAPGSPAQKAGLLKGDYLLTVDQRPIMPLMLPRIMSDLASRTGTAPIGILRGQEEKTLELPLDKP
ncbi:MAG: S1C family serine protease [Phycisphaerae bacterium]